MAKKICYFVFQGSLKDFLPDQESGKVLQYGFFGNPSIKDAMEAQGVPHVEVGSISVNGDEVDFTYKIFPEDKVIVHPLPFPVVQKEYPFFVVDSHLGKLAMDLRVLGFDSLYEQNYTEDRIIRLAEQDNRVVLTRNIGLLKNGRVQKGYWLRSQDPDVQIKEVINYFDLKEKLNPFTRCRICNGNINPVSKVRVEDQLPPMTKIHFEEFYQCERCKQVYWKGSHYEKMEEFVRSIKEMP